MRLIGIVLGTFGALAAHAAETFDIGLASDGTRIDAIFVQGASAPKVPSTMPMSRMPR
jgi:hypothetical protein